MRLKEEMDGGDNPYGSKPSSRFVNCICTEMQFVLVCLFFFFWLVEEWQGLFLQIEKCTKTV